MVRIQPLALNKIPLLQSERHRSQAKHEYSRNNLWLTGPWAVLFVGFSKWASTHGKTGLVLGKTSGRRKNVLVILSSFGYFSLK